jgi:TatD DNase family protein
MLIDSHSHVEMKAFDGDRHEVIARARDVGVSLIMAVGINEADCRRVVTTAERHGGIYGAVGIHPHHAKDITPATYDVLRGMTTQEKIIAYGEIGLDFFRNLSTRKIQISRFGEQLDLAQELDLPVIIHDREAHAETVALLEKWNGHKRGVIHCFSGDYGMARKCLDMGFYLSVPGTITFRKNTQLQDVVRKVPLSRLLVETDCPFLTPDPKRGERNEPAFVVHTASSLAKIKKVPLEEVERATFQNTVEVFGIPVP